MVVKPLADAIRDGDHIYASVCMQKLVQRSLILTPVA